MNEIIIRLADEDRARLDRLTEALEKNTHNCAGCVQSAIKMVQAAPAEQVEEKDTATPEAVQEPKNEPAKATEADAHPVEGVAVFDAPAAENPAPVTEEKPEDVKPAVTVKMSDIQQKVVALSAAGKKAEVKAIVTAYAERVTGLPEHCWGEVFAQLTALEQTLEG